ncbi:MAG: hypothetical protein ACXW61_03435 [Gemmatirosa sp.]
MSDVVIRCPHCGTTQQTLGECEACHESDARYFCANHAPGRWLDGPACAACGAHFTGRTAGVPPTPMPPSTPERARERAPERVPERVPERARPVDPYPTRPTPPRTRRAPMPPPPPREPIEMDGGWVEVDDRTSWPPARRPRDVRETRGPGWPTDIPIPTLRVGIGSVVGCLGRLVTAVVVLFVLAALAFFGYCGAPMGFDGESVPSAPTTTAHAVPPGG